MIAEKKVPKNVELLKIPPESIFLPFAHSAIT